VLLIFFKAALALSKPLPGFKAYSDGTTGLIAVGAVGAAGTGVLSTGGPHLFSLGGSPILLSSIF
jgi:hypothetical protein